ncbi:uncharacterized protein LOC115077030 [Rhinatrema bivittatum]|uniref:uncharacterized protein LOC115077030 n=1 Tax=Rhinatrema bivittatum TaxID=194408 RepID=UPI00112C6ED4|nr:uncharacterized protein LOC115077030 [Rhinatrema bivittatum]
MGLRSSSTSSVGLAVSLEAGFRGLPNSTSNPGGDSSQFPLVVRPSTLSSRSVPGDSGLGSNHHGRQPHRLGGGLSLEFHPRNLDTGTKEVVHQSSGDQGSSSCSPGFLPDGSSKGGPDSVGQCNNGVLHQSPGGHQESPCSVGSGEVDALGRAQLTPHISLSHSRRRKRTGRLSQPSTPGSRGVGTLHGCDVPDRTSVGQTPHGSHGHSGKLKGNSLLQSQKGTRCRGGRCTSPSMAAADSPVCLPAVASCGEGVKADRDPSGSGDPGSSGMASSSMVCGSSTPRSRRSDSTRSPPTTSQDSDGLNQITVNLEDVVGLYLDDVLTVSAQGIRENQNVVKYRPASKNVRADALSRFEIQEAEEDLPQHIIDPAKIQYLDDVLTVSAQGIRENQNVVKYRPASKNVRADALSRFEIQEAEEDLPQHIIDPAKIQVASTTVSPLGRVVVSRKDRRRVLAWAHDSLSGGHAGRERTLDLLNRYYWWPQIRQDVRVYVDSCPVCAQQKTA